MGKIATGGAGAGRSRIDYAAIRAKADLRALLVAELGKPDRHGRFLCPFHDDHNPSLGLVAGGKRYRCWVCGETGSALDFAMWRDGVDVVEAARRLDPALPAPDRRKGGVAATPRPAPRPASPPPKPPAASDGMSGPEAEALVASSDDRLWSPAGAEALAYLTGPERLLRPETIRAARLGYTPSVRAKSKEGNPYEARGVVIPWYFAGRLTLVKVRQPDGRRPKYAEVYRDRGIHTGIFPGADAIRPGHPLIVTEGEFDALVLSQELGDLAAVVTLGSASNPLKRAILAPMLPASPWYIATDNDPAGDRSAGSWPRRARRVRPPESFNDWSEAKSAGLDLRRWWADRLSGVESPPLFTWGELSARRWGPAEGDPAPGILIDRPDRTRMLAAVAAIQGEPGDETGGVTRVTRQHHDSDPRGKGMDKLIENRQFISRLRDTMSAGEFGLHDFPMVLKKILANGRWREFRLPDGAVMRYDRFEPFVTTRPVEGLGSTMEVVRKTPAFRAPAAEPGPPAPARAEPTEVRIARLRSEAWRKAGQLCRLTGEDHERVNGLLKYRFGGAARVADEDQCRRRLGLLWRLVAEAEAGRRDTLDRLLDDPLSPLGPDEEIA
jgi:hypothetical protein